MRVPIELVGLVDPGTLSRGARYADTGRTALLSSKRSASANEDRSSPKPSVEASAEGISRGSHGENYAVKVDYELTSNNVVKWMLGDCECLVGSNCKHAISLLILDLEAHAQGKAPDTAAVGKEDFWQETLEDIFGFDQQSLRVGLAFDFQEPTAEERPPWMRRGLNGGWRPPERSVRVRPVSPGKQSAWVQSEVTWNRLISSAVPIIDPRQSNALTDLYNLWQSGTHLGADGQWISLNDIGTPALWPVLREIADSGIALLEFQTWNPVSLEEEPARAEVGIIEDSPDPLGQSGLTVRAVLSHPSLDRSDPVVRFGTLAHGLAWRTADQRLHLAPLDTPASPHWMRLVKKSGGVHVPAEGRAQFESELLPAISRVGWVSPDSSFEPAPMDYGQIHLAMALIAGDQAGVPPRALLHWSWGPDFPAQTMLREGRSAALTGPRFSRSIRLPLIPDPRENTANLTERGIQLAHVGEPLRALPSALDDSLEATWISRHLALNADTSRAVFPRQDSELHGLEVITFVDQIIPELKQRGVVVDDVGAVHQFTEADAVSIEITTEETGGRDWLDLKVTMKVGDHDVPMEVLLPALTREEPALFLPSGEYVILASPQLDRLRELLAEARLLSDRRTTGVRVPRVRTSWWEELLELEIVTASQDAWLSALRRAAANPPEPPEIPGGLVADLRPYQKTGFEWLATLRRAGLGGVLADDMGLGKTVQTLAMIQDQRQEAKDAAPWLVVAPTSVVPNWVVEAGRFTPGLKVVSVDSTLTRRGVELAELTRSADIVVTSYALLRLEAEEYAELTWSGMILDEAQQAKNPASKTFRSLVMIGAPVVYAITGTPMENNLGELWAMFALTAPGLLGGAKQFRDSVQRPIERGEGGRAETLELLRKRIAPFLLRRTKQAVAAELPDKQEQVIRVDLEPGHRRAYDRQLQRERQRVLKLADDLDSNRVEVLSALTRLRQLSIDPTLVDEESTAPGSKLNVLVPLLAEASAEGHRSLVFSQFTRYLHRIAERLDAEGVSYVYLDGATRNRKEVIRQFSEGEAPVFLISLKAGGVGLNLTEADYVVIADPWWNPAVEAQAIDRAHRIGQTKPVFVYRLVSRGTIEEKVLALQDSKRELVAGVLQPEDVEGGVVGTGKLTADDLRMLLD